MPRSKHDASGSLPSFTLGSAGQVITLVDVGARQSWWQRARQRFRPHLPQDPGALTDEDRIAAETLFHHVHAQPHEQTAGGHWSRHDATVLTANIPAKTVSIQDGECVYDEGVEDGEPAVAFSCRLPDLHVRADDIYYGRIRDSHWRQDQARPVDVPMHTAPIAVSSKSTKQTPQLLESVDDVVLGCLRVYILRRAAQCWLHCQGRPAIKTAYSIDLRCELHTSEESAARGFRPKRSVNLLRNVPLDSILSVVLPIHNTSLVTTRHSLRLTIRRDRPIAEGIIGVGNALPDVVCRQDVPLRLCLLGSIPCGPSQLYASPPAWKMQTVLTKHMLKPVEPPSEYATLLSLLTSDAYADNLASVLWSTRCQDRRTAEALLRRLCRSPPGPVSLISGLLRLEIDDMLTHDDDPLRLPNSKSIGVQMLHMLVRNECVFWEAIKGARPRSLQALLACMSTHPLTWVTKVALRKVRELAAETLPSEHPAQVSWPASFLLQPTMIETVEPTALRSLASMDETYLARHEHHDILPALLILVMSVTSVTVEPPNGEKSRGEEEDDDFVKDMAMLHWKAQHGLMPSLQGWLRDADRRQSLLSTSSSHMEGDAVSASRKKPLDEGAKRDSLAANHQTTSLHQWARHLVDETERLERLQQASGLPNIV